MSLEVPRALLDAILAHARADAPREACGVLAGRGARVERIAPTKNAHPLPQTGYHLDPMELLAAVLRIEDEWGLEIVGYYHSHPEGPAAPSRVDVERATWPRAAHVIAWLAPQEGVGAWRLDEGRVEPLDLRIV